MEAIAIHDFKGTSDGDLAFRKDQTIKVIDYVDVNIYFTITADNILMQISWISLNNFKVGIKTVQNKSNLPSFIFVT